VVKAGDQNQEQSQYWLAVFGAAAAVTAWGSAGVVIRHIDMGGLAVAVYRFWIYAIALGVWMGARGTRIDLRILRHTMAGGIALALDVALFFSAVKETTIANATVIGALQPIVVGAVAWRFFGERIRGRQILLAAIALMAVTTVILGGASDNQASLFGDLLAVGALFAWSGYFIFSKASRDVLTPAEFTLGTALWTAALNTPLALLFGQDLSWPTTSDWGWLLLLAFGAGIVGHTAMNWSLVRIPLWLGSTFTLLIPVAGTSLAWLFLDEALKPVQIVAMFVVIGALAALVVDQTTADGAQPAPADPEVQRPAVEPT